MISKRYINAKLRGGGFNGILTMTEGTDTKYILTAALGSVTCVYDAAIAGMTAKKGETR